MTHCVRDALVLRYISQQFNYNFSSAPDSSPTPRRRRPGAYITHVVQRAFTHWQDVSQDVDVRSHSPFSRCLDGACQSYMLASCYTDDIRFFKKPFDLRSDPTANTVSLHDLNYLYQNECKHRISMENIRMIIS